MKRYQWLIVDGNGEVQGTNDEQVAKDLNDGGNQIIEISPTGESTFLDEDGEPVMIDEA